MYLKAKFDGILKTFLTLDVVGMLVALIFGALILFFGGPEGPYFLLILILFLAASALVTRFHKRQKVAMHAYEKARGWKNVVANGIAPLVIAFLYFLTARNPHPALPPLFLIVAYSASVAGITADKFSSEIGVLDRNAVMLWTMKRTKPGTSGGVSFAGILAGVAGSFIIGLSLFAFPFFALLFLIVFVSGLLGDFADSLFGYFEEKGIGNKYTSNVACAVVAAVVAIVLLML